MKKPELAQLVITRIPDQEVHLIFGSRDGGVSFIEWWDSEGFTIFDTWRENNS